jgi:hypothetical protein
MHSHTSLYTQLAYNTVINCHHPLLQELETTFIVRVKRRNLKRKNPKKIYLKLVLKVEKKIVFQDYILKKIVWFFIYIFLRASEVQICWISIEAGAVKEKYIIHLSFMTKMK